MFVLSLIFAKNNDVINIAKTESFSASYHMINKPLKAVACISEAVWKLVVIKISSINTKCSEYSEGHTSSCQNAFLKSNEEKMASPGIC